MSYQAMLSELENMKGFLKEKIENKETKGEEKGKLIETYLTISDLIRFYKG